MRDPTNADFQPIAVCDGRGATLLHAMLEPLGRLHLDVQSTLSNRWSDFHEHGRPMRLGQGPSANAVQHYADEHREPKELERRFAKDVALWLRDASSRAPDGHLPVFVAHRFLGALRAELVDDIDGIALHRAELQGMRPAEIAVHPAVAPLLRKALLPKPAIVVARAPQSP
jgi:hypothetical protein